jgi:hypothetical protein
VTITARQTFESGVGLFADGTELSVPVRRDYQLAVWGAVGGWIADALIRKREAFHVTRGSR